MKSATAFLFRGELKRFKYYPPAGTMAVIQLQSKNCAWTISAKFGEELS
ncbi:MAG TPA: hypothetical protein VGJ73_22010 [Verrucomicrobiae bacterium]|jgi:hypothetical protein